MASTGAKSIFRYNFILFYFLWVCFIIRWWLNPSVFLFFLSHDSKTAGYVSSALINKFQNWKHNHQTHQKMRKKVNNKKIHSRNLKMPSCPRSPSRRSNPKNWKPQRSSPSSWASTYGKFLHIQSYPAILYSVPANIVISQGATFTFE